MLEIDLRTSFAYEVLSNPEKWQLYDRYGEQGLWEGSGRGMDDIFSRIFVGGLFGFMENQSQSRNGRRRDCGEIPPGKVIEPGCVRVVQGERMPRHRSPFEKGDLYIKFDVQFPENNWINPDKLTELEGLLPSRPEVLNVTGETEEEELQEFVSTRGSGGGQRHEAYNDSSDEESSRHHGPGTQCAHQ